MFSDKDIISIKKNVDDLITEVNLLNNEGETPEDILEKLQSLNSPLSINVDKIDDHDASDFLLNSNYIQTNQYNDYNGYIKFKNQLQLVWGYVSITPVANTPTSATINFPISFTTMPIGIVSPVTSVPGTQVLGVGGYNISKTSIDIYVTRTNTTSTNVRYLIIGM